MLVRYAALDPHLDPDDLDVDDLGSGDPDFDEPEVGYETVNHQARWLVGIATGVSLLAAVWVSKAETGGVVPYAIYAFLNATPLLARDTRAFIKACRIGAVLLILCGIFGFTFGLFYFWPAAALLIMASHAAEDDGRIPRLLLTIGTLIGLLAAIGWGTAIYETALAPAHEFVVTFESQSAATNAAAGGGTNSITGTTGVSKSDRVWKVSFDSHLTPAERDQLQTRLRALPGVSSVGLCSRWSGTC